MTVQPERATHCVPRLGVHTLRDGLAHYRPVSMSEDAWILWRGRILDLAMAARPSSVQAAKALIRAAADVVEIRRPAIERSWPEILSEDAIAHTLATLAAKGMGPASLQARTTSYRHLRNAYLGLPLPGHSRVAQATGRPFSEDEFLDVWAQASAADEPVRSMLRFRLAVEVTTGVRIHGNPELSFRIADGTVLAEFPDGRPVALAPRWCALVVSLCGGTLEQVIYDRAAVAAWTRHHPLHLGTSRGRDAYLAEMWSRPGSTVQHLIDTRATHADIQRLTPTLPLPDSDRLKALIRGDGC